MKNRDIALVLPASLIPEGSDNVRKPTGEKPYIIRREIKIYGAAEKSITADENTVFLCDPTSGNANAISNDTKLAIDFDVDGAIEFLQAIQAEQEGEQ